MLRCSTTARTATPSTATYGLARPAVAVMAHPWWSAVQVMRLSLLRAPKAPDAHADMGRHVFAYALYPHAGTFQDAHVVRRAIAFNTPLLLAAAPATGAAPLPSMLSLSAPSLVIEAVKVRAARADASARSTRRRWLTPRRQKHN